MGKRILVQRRGRGGMRYRSHPKGKIAPASYPFIEHDKTTIGIVCLLYTSPSPRDATLSRMPSSG